MKRIIFSLFVGATAALSALPAVQAASEPVQVVPDAPSSYTVVRGDTLWSIAGRFIKDPWRWPEVWRMNRDQIRNPHLIYPGQVVMFDGRYLSIGKPVGDPRDIRPRVYIEDSDPIPTVPMSVISPFLTRPLVVDDKVMKDARTIVALDEKRVLSGEGNIVFADNIAQDNALGWEIFRPAKPIMDVDGKTVLAYESEQVADAALQASGEPATLEIIDAKSEVLVGDRVLPRRSPDIFSYVPHGPEHEVEGRVVGIYHGVYETGRHSVVTLNIGANYGLEPGHVLAVYRDRGDVTYAEKVGDPGKVYHLPSARIGLALVFRVFDKVAYAIITDADGGVKMGDFVRNP